MNIDSSSSTSLYIAPYVKAVALTLTLALCTMTMAPPVGSQETTSNDTSEGGNASSAAMGAAAGLSTLLYLPLKVVFAIGGESSEAWRMPSPAETKTRQRAFGPPVSTARTSSRPSI